MTSTDPARDARDEDLEALLHPIEAQAAAAWEQIGVSKRRLPEMLSTIDDYHRGLKALARLARSARDERDQALAKVAELEEMQVHLRNEASTARRAQETEWKAKQVWKGQAEAAEAKASAMEAELAALRGAIREFGTYVRGSGLEAAWEPLDRLATGTAGGETPC